MADSVGPRAGFGNVMRALRIRNYRTYTLGNAIALIGTWIQRVAVAWLAWELTHSGTWLGLCAAADLIPSVIVSPFAGALADRVDRLRLLKVTQSVGLLQAALLCILTYAGIITVEGLFLLTVALGVINATAQPARLALIPSLVEPPLVPAAVAINSLVFNGARFIGPAIAGTAIAAGSTALAFALNALSYVAFLVTVARIELKPPPAAPRRRFFLQSWEGYVYALRHPGIGRILALFAVSTVALRGFIEILAGFADDVFNRGAPGLAWLMATIGIGAVLGGISMLRRSGVAGLTARTVDYTLVMSLAVLAFTATRNYWLALPCLIVAGYALSVTGISAQTLVQTAVDPAMRGRVMGFYGMLFRAGPALGAMLMGMLSNSLGFRAPVAAGAALCLVSWLWAQLNRETMRRSLETAPDTAVAD
ncbi:MAG TPA: MFS transporter [Stellaceae bacterium]|nr:MFS transporter [Stellaceae bacterium]